MHFICLVTLREDVWYSFHGPECSNMAEKLKKVFFQNVPNGVRVLPAWGSSFAGMGFELCRHGVRVLPAKREAPWVHFEKKHFFHFLAIFEHSEVRKRYQASSLSVTRHLKRIYVFPERSL